MHFPNYLSFHLVRRQLEKKLAEPTDSCRGSSPSTFNHHLHLTTQSIDTQSCCAAHRYRAAYLDLRFFTSSHLHFLASCQEMRRVFIMLDASDSSPPFPSLILRLSVWNTAVFSISRRFLSDPSSFDGISDIAGFLSSTWRSSSASNEESLESLLDKKQGEQTIIGTTIATS